MRALPGPGRDVPHTGRGDGSPRVAPGCGSPLLWFFLFLMTYLLACPLLSPQGPPPMDYSAFRDELGRGNVVEVTVRGDRIQGVLGEPVTRTSESWPEGRREARGYPCRWGAAAPASTSPRAPAPPSTTWPARPVPSRSSVRSSSSCGIRPASTVSLPRCPGGCSLSVPRVPGRPCWPVRSPAKPTCRSSKAAPSIVFIDELGSIGRRRGTGLGGGHDERDRYLWRREDLEDRIAQRLMAQKEMTGAEVMEAMGQEPVATGS